MSAPVRKLFWESGRDTPFFLCGGGGEFAGRSALVIWQISFFSKGKVGNMGEARGRGRKGVGEG